MNRDDRSSSDLVSKHSKLSQIVYCKYDAADTRQTETSSDVALYTNSHRLLQVRRCGYQRRRATWHSTLTQIVYCKYATTLSPRPFRLDPTLKRIADRHEPLPHRGKDLSSQAPLPASLPPLPLPLPLPLPFTANPTPSPCPSPGSV